MSEPKRVRTLLEAWTSDQFPGQPPMYVNATQVGDMVEITLRSPAKDNGEPGETLTMAVNVWTLDQMARTLIAARKNFDCHRPIFEKS